MAIRWRAWNHYLLLALAAHFSLVYTLNTRPMLYLPAFESGKEHTPFQYRALTAWIYAAAARLLPIGPRLGAHLPPRMGQTSDFVTFGLSFVSLLVAVSAVRFSLERLTTGDQVWSRWGSLLVIVMAYPHYLLEFGHPCCAPMQLPYDLPSLAFFAVCLSLIVAGRLAWLYPVFAVATLNRESTIFLIVILLLYRSAKEPLPERWRFRLETLAHAVALLCLWFMERWILHRMYHPLPPLAPTVAGFEVHVRDNAGYLLKPFYWTSFLSMFGFSWIFVYAHWRRVPRAEVRRILWIGPIYLLAMYVVGILSEIRIFGELIPVYTLALVLLLRSLWLRRATGSPPQDVEAMLYNPISERVP